MSRIANLKSAIAGTGFLVDKHYIDGPGSGFRPKAKPGEENHVMITMDLEPIPEVLDKEKIMMHLFFHKQVHRVYFTKNSHRLKVIFNCRAN